MFTRGAVNPLRASTRRFQIVDGVVLVAALAVGFAWARAEGTILNLSQRLGPVEANSAPRFEGDSLLVDLAQVFLVPLSFALAALRLRRPRPRRLRLLSQPGFVATAGASCAFFVRWLECQGQYSDYLTSFDIWLTNVENAAAAPPIALVVLALWVLLATGGRWRAEASWIDRSGRAVGFLWIVAALTRRSPWLVP